MGSPRAVLFGKFRASTSLIVPRVVRTRRGEYRNWKREASGYPRVRSRNEPQHPQQSEPWRSQSKVREEPPTPASKERSEGNLLSLTLGTAWTLICVGIVYHAVSTRGISHGAPTGPSMLPTIDVDHQVILVDHTFRRGRGCRVGDIVVFKMPNADYQSLKRIIGMPGDFVLAGTPGRTGGELEGMMMQVCSRLNPHNAGVVERLRANGRSQVPQGHCFVAGDNQEFSRDSRMIGPVPLALILGKVWITIWPPWKMGSLENGCKASEHRPEPDSSID